MVVVDLDCTSAADGEAVAAALEQFTPVAETLRPGLHAFGARGPTRYFGGEQALGALVARAAASAAPAASRVGVGVADGLFTAGIAARTAARAATPSEVTVVAPQQGRQFLAAVSLARLREPVSPLHADPTGTRALLDVLWRLGIQTLGDLAELSEADMLGRFGWPGLAAHRLARGLDDRPLQAEADTAVAAAETEIYPPAERIEAVAFMARALAEGLVDTLARDGLDCVCVGVEAESDSGCASRRRWRHELRFDAPAIVDRVRWQLEGWYRSSQRPGGPVTLIRITPLVVAPAIGRQLAMWGNKSRADERAARALARVQGLLGAEAVTVPRLFGGRRPADTGRRMPLHAPKAATPGPVRATGAAAAAKRKRKPAKSAKSADHVEAPWPGRLPAPAPAVVLAEPEPVTVTDNGGAAVVVSGRGEASAPPQQLVDSSGRSRAVVAWSGPWPLDERWWRPSARRRQARFQLVLDDGSAHLCVLESGRWHREATYD